MHDRPIVPHTQLICTVLRPHAKQIGPSLSWLVLKHEGTREVMGLLAAGDDPGCGGRVMGISRGGQIQQQQPFPTRKKILAFSKNSSQSSVVFRTSLGEIVLGILLG